MVRRNHGIQQGTWRIKAINLAVGLGAKVYDAKGGDRVTAKLNKSNYAYSLQELTPHRIREMLETLLIHASDVDAFFIDYFPAVRKKMTLGMDRTTQFNILIESHEPQEVFKVLCKAFPQQIRSNSKTL